MSDGISYTLLASKGCGSAVVEACLAITGLPHAVEEIEYGRARAGHDRLLALNPLGQVPTLILPAARS